MALAKAVNDGDKRRGAGRKAHATSDINHPLAAATGRAQKIKKVTRTTTIVMTSLKSGQRVV